MVVMTEPRTVVLIADRNQLVAEALVDPFLDVAEVDARIVTSLAKALLTAQLQQPDLVLVDAWIGRTEVEELVRQIKSCTPGARVFVMASKVEKAFERRAKQAGADGCCETEKVPSNARAMLAAARKAR